jgi:hypothetical protein
MRRAQKWGFFSLAEKAEGLVELFFLAFLAMTDSVAYRPALTPTWNLGCRKSPPSRGGDKITLARGLISGLRASVAWARSGGPLRSLFTMTADPTPAAAAVKKPKLHGRAFYESIGSPKYIVAPMVDQSEFVSRPVGSCFCERG